MSAQHTPGPTVLSQQMASELAFELQGLQGAADDPDQYTKKIAALNSIAWGLCRVVRVPRGAAIAKATGSAS